jgi:glycine reductase complex component B subunit gamma
MSDRLRVVHYLNQFFAGVGGESAANLPVEARPGPVGPGRALQQILGDAGVVEATIVCGDNFFNDEREQAHAKVRDLLRELKPDVVVAGPAFEAGRYGLACAEVCRIAEAEGVPAVTGMHPESPGVLLHGREATIVPTGKSAADMTAALGRMAPLALRLGRGEALGPADVDGYLPRGIRKPGRLGRPGWERAIEMLIAKVNGRPYRSEVPYQAPEVVAPAAPIRDLSKASIALVTTGGLVPKGNPDGQTGVNAQKFFRYPVEQLRRMAPGDWEAFHVGYFTHIVDENPDYVLPLGLMRELESAGVIGSVSPYAWTLPGVGTPVATSQGLGVGIAEELRRANAGGCILVST